MPKQYTQCFRESWKSLPEFKGWLLPSHADKAKAYCDYCKCTINAKLCDLKKHVVSQKHKQSSHVVGSVRQPKITAFEKDASRSAAEGKLSLHIAEHSSFSTVDHLSSVCCSSFPDSKTATSIRLHRTKCREISVNVLAPHFLSELCADISEKYSILIDESTDISINKLLGVVVRYFSKSLRKVVSTHLGLVEIEFGTAESMADAIIKLIKDLNLKMGDLLGIGVDNASVNTGRNNGVVEILKKKLNRNDLIMVRCTCHSIQLAVSHACAEALPRNVEFIVKETFNWFSQSAKRQAAYSDLYSHMFEGKQPLKIPRGCDTRWLSIEPAVTRILSQWDALLAHFESARLNEKCFTAELLFKMYSDRVNKLYMLFLRPILTELNRVMKSFQSDDNDPTKLLTDLGTLIESVARRIVIPTARIDPYSDISAHVDRTAYLGYEFEKAVTDGYIPHDDVQTVRERCTNFVLALHRELRHRMPDNFNVLKQMSSFSISTCLNQVKPRIANIAETMSYTAEEIESIELEWNNLSLFRWNNTKSTTEFWIEVSEYEDAAGNNPFTNVSSLAMNLLALPHSNADVERLFSQVNLVETKQRNKLLTSTVNGILIVRAGLKRVSKCCHNYDLPKSVLNKIGTMAAYTAPSVGPTVEGGELFED